MMTRFLQNRATFLSDSFFHWLTPHHARLLASVCLLGAIVQTVLLCLPTWQQVPVTKSITTASAAKLHWQQQASAISDWHVFGQAPPPPSALPETTLQLSLVGIMQAGLPELSQAIIATPDGQEKVYTVGEAVPGGATIRAIHAQQVILDRAGTLEELPLPRDPLHFKPMGPTPLFSKSP